MIIKKTGIILGVLGLYISFTAADFKITASENSFLRRGQETVIDYGKQYAAHVDSREQASMVIREYGIRQRALYDNPEVQKIEAAMEEECGILAVNLGEIDPDTAKDIESAFTYMYEQYPILQGTLTNLTIANFPIKSGSELAITQTREFMMDTSGATPYVVKTEILLNALQFFDREKMIGNCRENVEDGYWPRGSNVTSIIVHELGHQLMDVISMYEFGLYDGKDYTGYYITEENIDAYSRYVTDSVAANQTVCKKLTDDAYALWKDTYGETGTREEFCESISGYASGKQPDGGISYSETIAEAVADEYLNGEEAKTASKAIMQCICEKLNIE